MQQKTSIIITVTTAILLAVVFYLSGKPKQAFPPLGTEKIPANEKQAIARSIELLRQPAPSNNHSSTAGTKVLPPKIHGCATGDFQVIANLRPELNTTLLQPGVVYPLWARFSSNHSSLDDTQAAVQTLSIKLFDVPGEKYFGEENTHDLIFRSHSVFPYSDAASYAEAIAAFANGQPLKYFFNPLSPKITAFRIHKASHQQHLHLLGIDWWSALPYRYGRDHAVKYALRPCSLSSVKEYSSEAKLGKDFLRDTLIKSLRAGPACFDFLVQFQTSPDLTPIEDPSVPWDETIAPFEPIARVNFPAQTVEPNGTSQCESREIHPWRAVPEHRPLGGINRLLREIYPAVVGIKDL